ncbi:MAG: hypothetical protein M3Y57_12030 [Acidobacteriota bacterium]|nr:hypothetical protein [Acidobacteriota bacterium]
MREVLTAAEEQQRRELLGNYYAGYEQFKNLFDATLTFRLVQSEAPPLKTLQKLADDLRYDASLISEGYRAEVRPDPTDSTVQWIDRYKDGAQRAIVDAYWAHKPEVKLSEQTAEEQHYAYAVHAERSQQVAIDTLSLQQDCGVSV